MAFSILIRELADKTTDSILKEKLLKWADTCEDTQEILDASTVTLDEVLALRDDITDRVRSGLAPHENMMLRVVNSWINMNAWVNSHKMQDSAPLDYPVGRKTSHAQLHLLQMITEAEVDEP